MGSVNDFLIQILTVTMLPVGVPILLFMALELRQKFSRIAPDQRRLRTGIRIGRLTILSTALTYGISLVALVGAGWLDRETANIDFSTSSSIFQLLNIFGLLIIQTYIFIFLIIALIIYLLLPGVVGFLLAIIPALRWRDPIRIIVLRRFQRDDASQALRDVLKERVAPFGHVFTLADRDIKVRWYVRLPLLLTQLIYLHFRPRRVRDQQDIARLLRRLRVRWARNLNWFVSWTKTFPIRSADTCWQQCVEALTNTADIVIIDVSELSRNIAWEIDRCTETGASERLVFLSSQTQQEAARIALGRWTTHDYAKQLITYDTEDVTRLETVLNEARNRRAISASAAGNATSFGTRIAEISGMIGPILWTLVFLAAIMLASPTTDDLPQKQFLSDELVLLAMPATRAVAFNRLQRILDESSNNFSWQGTVSSYVDHVLPLFAEVWDEDPHWRVPIIKILNQLDHPGAGKLWLRAIEDLDDSPENVGLKLQVLERANATDPAFFDRGLIRLARNRLASLSQDQGARAVTTRILTSLAEHEIGILGPGLRQELLGDVLEGDYPQEMREAAAHTLVAIARNDSITGPGYVKVHAEVIGEELQAIAELADAANVPERDHLLVRELDDLDWLSGYEASPILSTLIAATHLPSEVREAAGRALKRIYKPLLIADKTVEASLNRPASFDEPTRLRIDGGVRHRDIGTIVWGWIETGHITSGGTLEFVSTEFRAPVQIERQFELGDDLFVAVVTGVAVEHFGRATMLAAPDTVQVAHRFRAHVSLNLRSESGRATPLYDGYEPGLSLGSTILHAVLHPQTSNGLIWPGSTGEVNVQLQTSALLAVGTKFGLQHQGTVIGSGIVVAIND